jgi:hypothetical protein
MKKILLTKGQIIVQAMVFSSIAILLIGGLIGWAGTNIQVSRQSLDRERAIQFAEAGIDYYRWHLAHSRTDYQDGTGSAGPYVHDVLDRSGNVIGHFSLSITPPIVGSTKVHIESTGIPLQTSYLKRTIAVEMAIPSFAKYSVVANDNMRFGAGTEIFGPMHSNGGIRFDGLAHNVVTSAQSSYDDPDHSGGVEFGVHTHVTAPPGSGVNDNFRPLEAPPSAVPSRVDVFEAGRQFPVPAADFAGITSDLAQIKTSAQTASGKYFAASGAQGYLIVLKTNDTFDIYKVNSQTAAPNGCTNVIPQTGWGTWSVNTKQFIANYAIPSNGLIFVEDNVWVEGQINTARLTIAAGKFPDNASTRPSITVNNNLLYTNYDGSDVLSLISQGDVNVGLVSADTLRIDAALVAQNGRVGRYYYQGPGGGNRCSPYHSRSSITLYGMIATNIRYGFAYTDGTGYQTRTINYDANLLYGPPPSFPLTSDQYEILSWEEL